MRTTTAAVGLRVGVAVCVVLVALAVLDTPGSSMTGLCHAAGDAPFAHLMRANDGARGRMMSRDDDDMRGADGGAGGRDDDDDRTNADVDDDDDDDGGEEEGRKGRRNQRQGGGGGDDDDGGGGGGAGSDGGEDDEAEGDANAQGDDDADQEQQEANDKARVLDKIQQRLKQRPQPQSQQPASKKMDVNVLQYAGDTLDEVDEDPILLQRRFRRLQALVESGELRSEQVEYYKKYVLHHPRTHSQHSHNGNNGNNQP
ncbi:hypothetical protein PTSG_04813 [Salpingoeca rosetta]|uniref:Uncharacterized protein n=1 Tax=Salpingoeca rosetta (strain ATCC 50818 / BSB-021) TaxID=946362 RepID=F2U9S3_SALR5|nr:uncharacterized protein PTSG_04813 [Salpingoeca rosetta]EGD73100.1 hypothetical protein PTSG_04813 [Salpingoeca rosetta]|eukprot:XP_004994131.1 hypothetical protein PTSG_04813 [Salpingoeca rosetta]